jgi:gluconokinase
MRRTLPLPDTEAIERELAARAPDAHGLTFLPFLSGERSVGWRPDARATLHGLSMTTTPLDILQAGMEGVALRFMLVADALRRQFPQANEVVASGGALGQSPVWAQMIADALGLPILLSKESEASSRGAALTALRFLGLLKDWSDAPSPPGVPLAPDPERHAIYRRALERQQALYRCL